MHALALLFALNAQAEEPPPKHFVSTSAFMLFNLIPFEEPPKYAQLNFGTRLTERDTLVLQAITWQYHGPQGRGFYNANEDGADHGFPGRVRDIGAGLAYQRYLWRNLYAGVDATAFHQRYLDEQGDSIQVGFQLFVTARVGYTFRVAQDRLFLEPSLACTSWPINTNLPADFAALDDLYPGFLLAEPGFNVGVQF